MLSVLRMRQGSRPDRDAREVLTSKYPAQTGMHRVDLAGGVVSFSHEYMHHAGCSLTTQNWVCSLPHSHLDTIEAQEREHPNLVIGNDNQKSIVELCKSASALCSGRLHQECSMCGL